MKNFFLTLLFSVLTYFLQAQQAFLLQGKVHREDGMGVSHVTLQLEGTNLLAITDKDGNYSFGQVPSGKYKIRVSSIEIKAKKLHLDLHKNYPDLHVHIDPKGSLALDEVRVEAKSEKRKIETSGFAVNVIDTKEAALQSIQTNELLGRSAGVRIRQDGGLGSHVHYNLNGLSGSSVRVFIDGIPASNYGSAFSLNSIPPALIERIDVFKGVVPAYLSDDALGGAINVVLKQNISKNSLVTSYSLGSFNTHQWNMTGSFRKKNGFAADASAFYNYSDNNYEVWGQRVAFKDASGITQFNQRGKRFNDAYKSYGGRANVGFVNVKWADRFFIGTVLSKDYKEIQHGRSMDKPYGDRHSRAISQVVNLAYEKKDLFLDGLSFKADASYSYLKRQVIDTVGNMYDWQGKPIMNPDGSFVKYNSGAEVGNAKTLGINSDKTFVTRLNLGYSINPNHHVFANYLFNNFKRGTSDELEPMGLQRLTNTRDLQKSVLSLTYENLAFSNKLRTNIFYKHYFQKVTSNEPYLISANNAEYGLNQITNNSNNRGYGIAVSYAVLPKLFILGSAEQALRLPNANELFGNLVDNLLAPKSSLNPEKSLNANLGVNLGPFVLDKHTIRLNSSLFFRDTKGMIREGMPSGNNEFTSFENLEDVLTKGFDTELIYNYAERFIFSFNVSKTNALFNTEFNSNGQPYLYYRTQIRNEPSLKFNSNLVYNFPNLIANQSHTSLYYNINYVESFLRNWANVGGNNLDLIPTQFVNDIGFAYTIPSKKATISFDAKNIFNQQVFDNFGLQKPGRAFYTKITFSII